MNGGEKMATEQTQLQPSARADVARPMTKIGEFRGVLDQMKPQIKMALPRHLDPDRMLRIVLTTVQRTPKLLDCTKESLLGCIVSCAQLGLEPDGLLGHAYLIPFFNSRKNVTECQLIVGYKGLRKLAMQSGEVSSISARVVHEKDDFDYEYGLNEKLRHVPSDAEDPGKVTYAYAIFRLKDGGHHFDVMTAREINRIRDNSQGYKRDKNSSPWTQNYDEMAKKTAFRRASKMAPASIDDRTAKAFALDDRAEQGLPQDIGDGISITAPEDEDQSAGPPIDATEAPAKEFVMSTLAQRKQLAKDAKSARVSEDDVSGWYKKKSLDELSFDDANDAAKRLAEVIAGEGIK
ncbi:recombinase RecT [Phenylobacterium sp.]|uniref:recombinase RecT n=1 Tax=Phenylobacterium sp. TaxID=1871053 RepID=UPI0025FA7D02|nr:recombinase RecT [Phenylobacterium sp.]